jgi:molybdopterin-guanine dinucleotide biosynthesis protein A
MSPQLEESLAQGMRKVGAWTKQHGAREVFFSAVKVGGRQVDPFFNINRPEELAEADDLLRAETA